MSYSISEVTGPRGGVLLVLALVLAAGSSLVALGPYDMQQTLMLMSSVVMAAGGLLVLLQWPQLGIIVMLMGGMYLKREISTGTQSGLNAAFLMIPVLVVVWLLRLMLRRGECSRAQSRTQLPIYVFMGIAVLAFLVGQYPWIPAESAPITGQLAELSMFLCSGALFLFAAYHLQDVRWLKCVTYVFIVMGGVHLALRLILPRLPGPFLGLLPLDVWSGSMFWMWVVAIPAGQAILNRDLRPITRIVFACVAVAGIGIALWKAQAWMSGWLPGLIAVGVILILRYPIHLIAASPALAMIAIVANQYLTRVATAGDNIYSLETRAAALQTLLPIMSVNPLLGVGPANYYYYSVIYPIMGWYVRFSSHNNYLDLVAQTGLLGLASFLWFGLALWWTGWELRKRPITGFEAGYIHGAIGGLVGTYAAAGLGDWVIPFVYNAGFAGFRTSILPWLFFGGLVALEQHVRRRG